MPNGTTALSSLLLLSTTPLVAQAVLADEKILGLLIQLPAVAVVVWLLIQQNKDRNRRDGEQSAMLREMVTAQVNSTKVMENCADAIRGNSAVIAELKRDQASIRESVAHQRSILEKLRGEPDHKAALHHTQRVHVEDGA
jgi:hypothetical protein